MLKHKAVSLGLFTALVLGGAAVWQGCGSSSDEASTPAGAAAGYLANVTYGGTGSAYTAEIKNDLTFTITKKESLSATAVDFTVTGSYKRLTSGILELTVGAVTPQTTNGPQAGAKAYALDVPGFVFLLKPMGSQGGEIIPMVALGNCPSTDYSGNWVIMQSSATNVDFSTEGLAGSFTYTASSSVGAVGASQYRSSGAVNSSSAQSLGALTCSGGIGTFPSQGGGSPEMYFTSGAGGIVRVPAGASDTQSIVMVPSAALTLSEFAGTYVGLMFDENDTSEYSQGKTVPVSATFDANGAGTGAEITNVETNAKGTDTATLALSQLSPAVNGILKMTITAGSDVSNNVCVAAKQIGGSTQNVIFCAGESGSGNTKLTSYLLVTKQ